jgi:sec-independent protein translocase protein TatA
MGARLPARTARRSGARPSEDLMGSGLLQPTHLIILLVIALVVLGPKRLPDAARSLGSGLRGFKDSLDGDDDEPARRADITASVADAAPAPAPAAAPVPVPREAAATPVD